MEGYDVRSKNDTARTILTGYYTAYYLTCGKKGKSPNTLIRSLYDKPQSHDEGLKEIERIKKLEKGGIK